MFLDVTDSRINGTDRLVALVAWDAVEEILGGAYADRTGEREAVFAAIAGDLPGWAAGMTAADLEVDERWGLRLVGPALAAPSPLASTRPPAAPSARVA